MKRSKPKVTCRHLLLFGCSLILGLFICGFISLYLYAKFGGDWASSRIISIPPEAQLITDIRYTENAYDNRLRLYTLPGTLAEGRTWFTSNNIPMEPWDEALRENDDLYCSLPFNPGGQREYFALWIGAGITGMYSPTYEVEPDCFSVCVHKSTSTIDNPQLSDVNFTFPEGSIAFTVNTCWPTW